MITIVNTMMTTVTAAMIYMKVKRVDPKSSHHRIKCSFYCVFMRQWMLTAPAVVIISQQM